MSFFYFGRLFATQKSGFPGFRCRSIPMLRSGTACGSPYNPCRFCRKSSICSPSFLTLHTIADCIVSAETCNPCCFCTSATIAGIAQPKIVYNSKLFYKTDFVIFAIKLFFLHTTFSTPAGLLCVQLLKPRCCVA